MEEYIEVPFLGRIFPSYDIKFDEMVKMDAETMQSMCQLNKEYGAFCSKDNEEFWAAKYAYFAKGLGMPDESKSKWVQMYKKVRAHPKRYLVEAIEEDKPSILVIMEKCNAEINGVIIRKNMHKMRTRVLNYLLSNVYTGERGPERFKNMINYTIKKHEMYFSLEFVKILYKYGIILDHRHFRRHPEFIQFYLQEGVIDPSIIRPRSSKDFRDFKKYGIIWRNMIPDGIEDLFSWCDYEYINELFNDGMTLDDLRNADPIGDTSYLNALLFGLLYGNTGVEKVCVNRILSKMRKLGLTVKELNEAYAKVHEYRREQDEEDAAEALAEAEEEAEAVGLQAAQDLAAEFDDDMPGAIPSDDEDDMPEPILSDGEDEIDHGDYDLPD